MNPGLKALLEADEERYPRSLEAKFKRIFDKIIDLWGTPGLEDYFTSLLIDDRGGRQGFPGDVMRDIFFLHGRRGVETPFRPCYTCHPFPARGGW